MNRSALGLVLSFLVFFLGAPLHARETSPAPSASKKTSYKKAAPIKRRTVKHPSRKSNRVANSAVEQREKLVKKTVVVNGRRKVVSRRVTYAPAVPADTPVLTAGDVAGLHLKHDSLALKSNVALVMDQSNAQILFEKNANVALPIASITKLMTAMVVLDAQQPMDEMLEVTSDDIDRERNSASRLRVGTRMNRDDMLHIALMSSENRAASALGRNYPGGLPAFVAAMNAKARALGMLDAHYVEPTGLSSQNVASARDLAKLVMAAYQYPVIREYSTDLKYAVPAGRRTLQYVNSNRLVANSGWDIGLQKTGYITEAGRCLVMQAKIEGRSVVMVFLDSKGKLSRIGDASRIRRWLATQKTHTQVMSAVAGEQG
ncbi:D-alanyl-D-alanine endopeptidase [Noviherbaspirillum massiliense]|uniref:D-alanyl-D-alanine endopeptidase n=1 Tax=Noviherbaspirillum massiliense TaxID=1465823 RepID=UPI001FE02694|nr:D-alanyl-D-alanine endopeptidase [Noviherbaspirillum massiliense]